MKLGLVLGVAMVLPMGVVQAAETFSLTPHEMQLEVCVDTARDVGAEFGICIGTVTELCLSKLETAEVSAMEEVLCLQEEVFAWDNVGMRASRAYLAQLAGRSDLSREAFIEGMEQRLAVELDTCFKFPPGQEALLFECKISGAIDRLLWTYTLSDAVPE